jgi:hypothetical protein
MRSFHQSQDKNTSYDKSIHYETYLDLEEKNANLYYKLDKDQTGSIKRDTLRWNLKLKNYGVPSHKPSEERSQTNTTFGIENQRRKFKGVNF